MYATLNKELIVQKWIWDQSVIISQVLLINLILENYFENIVILFLTSMDDLDHYFFAYRKQSYNVFFTVFHH